MANKPVYLTSFVGRARELAEIGALLASRRIVTLTGPGGGGKTRLAAQLATDLAAHTDTAWWVSLAEIQDGALVAQTIAEVLGVREAPRQPLLQAIAAFIGEQRALLILDNCEHLLQACAEAVDALLRACPGLQILATSREPLGPAGEAVWQTPPLSLPQSAGEADLLEADAVRLFLERARAARPGFTVTPENSSAVRRVCRRLDGIPLALELAAARVSLLSVHQIAGRLDDRFALLRGGPLAVSRHQTLRAAVDWSHDLLSAPEQVLFRRLAVFVGGFTLEAAEAICTNDGVWQEGKQNGEETIVHKADVLDLLGGLVSKSLVVVDHSGDKAARYHLLETFREYALGRLRAAGEAEALRGSHQHYFVGLATGAGAHLGFFLSDEATGLWLGRLQPEHSNLRAALREGLSADVARREAALRLAGSLHWYWFIHGYFTESRQFLADLLVESEGTGEDVRALAQATAGYLACWQGDFVAARPTLEAALAGFARLEAGHGIALATHGLGWVATGKGETVEAQRRFEEALAIATEAEDGWMMSFSLHFLAISQAFQGDYEQARHNFEQCVAISRALGGATGAVAFSHFHLGRIDRIEGAHDAAGRHLRESLRLFKRMGDLRGITYALVGYGALAAARQEARRAARLCGAVEGLRERLGVLLEAPLLAEHGKVLADVHAALGDSAFAEMSAQGAAMALDEVAAYAVGDRDLPHRTEVVVTAPDADLRLFALGQTRVLRGDRLLAAADWTFAKPKELLFYLVENAPRSKEQIGVDLWPEASPEQLRSSLKAALYQLRQALGRNEWVLYEHGRYSFNRSLDYWYDVELFESALEEARERQMRAPGEAIQLYDQALRLYEGDYVADLTTDLWPAARREALRRAYQDGLLSHADLLFAESLYERALEAYRRAVSVDEFVEEAHRGQMRALSRLGEPGLAVQRYRALVELLADELGVEPAPETLALYRKLQRGEPL